MCYHLLIPNRSPYINHGLAKLITVSWHPSSLANIQDEDFYSALLLHGPPQRSSPGNDDDDDNNDNDDDDETGKIYPHKF